MTVIYSKFHAKPEGDVELDNVRLDENAALILRAVIGKVRNRNERLDKLWHDLTPTFLRIDEHGHRTRKLMEDIN